MTKRRLPILQPGGDDEQRPAWQWAILGAVAILLGWIPLAMLAQLAAKRVATGYAGPDAAGTAESLRALSPGQRLTLSLLVVVGPLLALAFASLLGGLLIGRFGGTAGKKEATVAGAAAAGAASLAVALQLLQTGGAMTLLLTAAVVVIVAALSARGGALLGLRWRARAR